jgi:DNA-directed RNA polymerase specialized sigma24 family protein
MAAATMAEHQAVGDQGHHAGGRLLLLRDAGEIVEKTLRDLAVRFGGTFSEADREDIAQEAYRKVLEADRRGIVVRAPLAMVKKAARNLALDRLRASGRVDQLSAELVAAGASADPESVILTRADLVRGIEAAEQLPPEQKAVYRATVIDGLSPQEACRLLSMPRSTFFKYRQLALSHVQSAQLSDNPEFDRGEYKLLSAYALGIANAREKARVRRLLRHDPRAAAILRDLRRGHEVAGAALPPLGVFGHEPIQGLAGVFARGRDAITSVLNRGAAEGAEHAAAIAGSGAGRAGGVAGAGLLAKVTLGGGGQAALACLVGGGAVVACVATGVLPSPIESSQGEGRPAAEQVEPERHRPAQPVGITSTLPSQLGHEKPPSSEANGPTRDGDGGEDATSTTATTPSTEPVIEASTPAVEQEFGVDQGAVPASGPAPADTNDSDGASAGTVRQEFGP